MDISVIIPVFNEERNIPVLYRRLKNTLNQISHGHEMIFINDGSLDKSFEILNTLRKRDKKVKIISFSRNFGHMAAIDAGLSFVGGKKTVIIDADLQDPPEIIEKMYKKSKEGFDVVYGVKNKRKEGPVRKTLFGLFYKLLNITTPIKMPINAGTFSLLDSKVVNILKRLPERNKYFSGLRFWSGFSQVGVNYERGKRHSGNEASFQRLLNLALNGLFSFSYMPLKIASLLGFFLGAVSLLLIVIVILGRIFWGLGIVGWASTLTTVLFIGSVQLITLGIIGEYLARIYDEVKERPEFIISKKVGLR